jgi:hypothetical protein
MQSKATEMIIQRNQQWVDLIELSVLGRHLLLAAVRPDLRQADCRNPRMQKTQEDGHHRSFRLISWTVSNNNNMFSSLSKHTMLANIE